MPNSIHWKFQKELAPGQWVEAGHGLVEQQQVRLLGQCEREADLRTTS